MDDLTIKATRPTLLRAALDAPSGLDLWLCTLIGIGITAGLFVITDYYTSTRFRPVQHHRAGLGRPGTRPTSSRASPRASSPRPRRRS